MDNTLTLKEQKLFESLVLETNGLLTENIFHEITNLIKKKISPEKAETIKQELSDGLGIDENSSKEDIQDILIKKTGGDASLLKKILREFLSLTTSILLSDLMRYIEAVTIYLTDFNPFVILAVIISWIFSSTKTYEKYRRKVLGPKIDKFLNGKKVYLGDYDDKDNKGMKENMKLKKVIKLTENDIEKLVKKIIKEEENNQPEQKQEKQVSLLRTNNGELSTIDGIVRSIQQAKMAFEDLCNSKLTGQDGYSKEIDGIVNDFTKLEDKVRKSKETVGKFVQQKSREDHMRHHKQKQMDYMRKKEEAVKKGRFYA